MLPLLALLELGMDKHGELQMCMAQPCHCNATLVLDQHCQWRCHFEPCNHHLWLWLVDQSISWCSLGFLRVSLIVHTEPGTSVFPWWPWSRGRNETLWGEMEKQGLAAFWPLASDLKPTLIFLSCATSGNPNSFFTSIKSAARVNDYLRCIIKYWVLRLCFRRSDYFVKFYSFLSTEYSI